MASSSTARRFTACADWMHVLVFNIRMDAADTALGFTTTWINGLAERFERVSVVTIHQGKLRVCDNVSVYSLGGEGDATRTARVRTLYRVLRSISSSHPIDACFQHMTLRLALLVAPIMKKRRVPTLLWYAHGASGLELRLAERVVERCVTSTPSGFGIPSAKLSIIGQGIDIRAFVPPEQVSDSYRQTIVSIGRITAAKRLDDALRAVARLRETGHPHVRFDVIGGPITDADRAWLEDVRALSASLGLSDAVRFRGPVGHAEIHRYYHRGAVFLNLGETRSLDKAILESMASGCIPVSRNESFRAIADKHGIGFLVPGAGSEEVARVLQQELQRPDAQRVELSRRLRGIVVEEHGLDRLLNLIAMHLRELAGDRALAKA
jgi:glycosyltransferase involved in cell wall biosynthesis